MNKDVLIGMLCPVATAEGAAASSVKPILSVLLLENYQGVAISLAEGTHMVISFQEAQKIVELNQFRNLPLSQPTDVTPAGAATSQTQ